MLHWQERSEKQGQYDEIETAKNEEDELNIEGNMQEVWIIIWRCHYIRGKRYSEER